MLCETTDPMPLELRLAAIITLLSSSAIRGATPCKSQALRLHLEAAALSATPLNAQLRIALENALAEWLNIECHQKSVPVDVCALASAGQSYH
ncbi:MAG: hypothetical protein QM739_01725 [Propionivibrio sp.]